MVCLPFSVFNFHTNANMSLETDNIVYKRQNKGRIHKDITKRVSFNEDALDEHKISELKLLHSEDFDAESKKILIDSCKEAEKCDLLRAKNDREFSKPQMLHSTLKKCLSAERRREFPPFVEREAPEGQEDPKKYCSTPNLSEYGSEAGSCKDLSRISGMYQLTSR